MGNTGKRRLERADAVANPDRYEPKNRICDEVIAD
jgi:hypothetical protein